MFSLFGKKKNKDAATISTESAPAAVEDRQPAPVSNANTAANGSAPSAATTAADAGGAAGASTTDAPADPSQSQPSHSLNVDALLAPSASAAASSQPEVGPLDQARYDALSPKIVEAISTVFDPEIPVNIYELGLIYQVVVDADSKVDVKMTLTSPACPSAQQLPSEVRYKVKAVEGVADCHVDVIWEPPWTKDMMSEAAKLSLGIF
jgi:FeS assembly SUF system protein